MSNLEINQQLIDAQKEYLSFLDDEEGSNVYHKRVKEMIDNKSIRLLVSINQLRSSKPARAQALFVNAAEEMTAFHAALKELVRSIDPKYTHDEFYIGFEGSFGYHHVTPRTLTADYLNTIVCLEGIVTQCSLVRLKIVRTVHFCPATQKHTDRRYTDAMSLNPSNMNMASYPTRDIDGNLLETEYGLSYYKDHQTLAVQEMPEKAPAGQLPRSVDVICDDDLADRCSAGDRVHIVGVYRCLPAKKNGFTTGIFRTVLLANNIIHMSNETKLAVSRSDISNCRKLAKRDYIFDMLANSLAPSIHGHTYVKKALLCMLVGGVEKTLDSGMRLRGDINILLIGDPSVAKSQLLRYVLCTAPRAIATTGRGSSGVGLTAAVTSDRESGERRLEAGAMVLADRGIVCIDEFDKMSDIDRTAIHEVMEQGRVTIAKAGIHARLNARCSVLAAANPVYGKYDQYKPPMENIGLQDSLLSRFDLLFVMLDTPNSDVDTIIADHVVRMHRYRNPGEPDGTVLPMGSGVDILSTNMDDEKDTDEEADIQMYEKYDPLLHGKSRENERIFSVKFMKMYIHVAKSMKPVLTDAVNEVISEEYARLRSQDSVQDGEARTQPVTVRTLETMIRLATAHAKIRLSTTVELEDAYAAIEMVQFAYFKKVLEKDRLTRRSKRHNESAVDSDEESTEAATPRQSKRRRVEQPSNQVDADATDPAPTDEFEFSETTEEIITDERFAEFKKRMAEIFTRGVQVIDLKALIEALNANASPLFLRGEIDAGLAKMSDANQIMISDGKVILI